MSGTDTYTQDDLRAAIAALADEAPATIRVRAQPSARRRHRLVPIVAAVATLTVVAVVLALTFGRTKGNQTAPIGRGAPTAAHPCRSRTTPTFDTFTVIGATVTTAAACAGFRSQDVEVGGGGSGTVVLFAPQVFDPGQLRRAHRVSGFGVSGRLGGLLRDPTSGCRRAFAGRGVTTPCTFVGFAWRYAPDSWGLVYTSADFRNEALEREVSIGLLRVASRVRLESQPIRVPLRIGHLPSGTHGARASWYGDDLSATESAAIGDHGADVTIASNRSPILDVEVESVSGPTHSGGTAIRVPAGTAYLQPRTKLEPATAFLRHRNCQLTITELRDVPRREVVGLLRSITFADCTHPATWPTANAALPH